MQDLLSQDSKNSAGAAKINLSDFEKRNLKQIKIDVLRTQPEIGVFKSDQMQGMMTRILFSWAVRHPASGYVQGISDLCAPLLLVFVSEFVFKADQKEHNLCQESVTTHNHVNTKMRYQVKSTNLAAMNQNLQEPNLKEWVDV